MDIKADKIKDIIVDNLPYFLLLVVPFLLLFKFVVPEVQKVGGTLETNKQVKEQLEMEQTKYENLKMQQAAQNRQKKVVKDGKVVYEVKGMKFSPEASFAPLFELVLTVAQQSGIRIHSIDYNYSPVGDKIFDAKIPGYNAAELAITAVGTYTEFQTFFKSVIKEPYVSNFAEMEITPWDRDKKILINKFKLRLYTKTME